MMRRSFTLLVSVLLALVLSPHRARADQSTAHSVSVAVLAFDSEDSEEQAEALTGALRSRIRASQAWSLIDAPQPLGMLSAALRCPGKPLTPECQQKVSEQIKAERYVFGYVTKGPQAGQVTAEIHLFQRGKSEVVIKEGYADNLKDQNDDTLKKIAQRALDRLGGTAVGVVIVRTSEKESEVIVDGSKRVPIKGGMARIELAAGGHSVEVSYGGETQKRNVLVQPGKEATVEFGAPSHAASTASDDKPFPTRKVVGFTTLGLAIAGGVVSAIHIAQYADAQSEADSRAPEFARRLPAGLSADEACDSPRSSSEEVCKVNQRSKRASTIAIVSGGIGGAFLLVSGVLLLTDWFSGDASLSREKSAKANAPKTRLVPAVGINSSSLMLTGSF